MLRKAYLRYKPSAAFGVITSPQANAVLVSHNKSGSIAATAALENLAIWNIKQGKLIYSLSTENHNEYNEITYIISFPSSILVACGYSNGSIRVFDVEKGERKFTFHGHSSAVTTICLGNNDNDNERNKDISLLVSGSRDTDIVVWDVIGEQGRFRLRGHTGEVTSLKLIKSNLFLISSSKDTLIKIWDLQTQHCIQTLVNHRNEVWSIAINSEETRLVTGASDAEIRVWKLHFKQQQEQEEENNDNITTTGQIQPAVFFGSFLRHTSRSRVQTIHFSPGCRLLAIQGADKTIEFYSVLSQEEKRHKLAKKRRRQERKRRKLREKHESENTDLSEENIVPYSLKASDEFVSLPELRLRVSHKIRSFCFGAPTDSTADLESDIVVRLLLSFHNNTLCLYELDRQNATKPFTLIHRLDFHGHPTGVRALALSSNDSQLASVCSEQLRIWNTHSTQCISVMNSGYGLALCFIPGDKQIVVGTRSGDLQLFDLSSADCVQEIHAHEGAIWSMQLSPDNLGIVTGSADKELKFWSFEQQKKEKQSLSLNLTRKMLLSDDILNLRFSPDGQYIAVALLDCTIRVFFTDSLKFFLSLYGHRLPVLCIDISSDGTLLVSGSADKNVKIWGLDFGDCHKSIFAHDGSVLQVRFVSDTHYFFSCGKDKKIKYWDADRFEQILSLSGHHAEVWALAMNLSGNFLVSTGNDHSIRFWEQTGEHVYIDDERQRELNEIFEQDITREHRAPSAITGSGILGKENESGKPTKASLESIKAGEWLIDCLDIVLDEEKRWDEYHQAIKDNQKKMIDMQRFGFTDTKAEDITITKPSSNLLLSGRTTERFLLDTLLKIRSAYLEEALLVMTFEYVVHFLKILDRVIQKGWEIELCVQCVLLVSRIHHNQIVTAISMKSLMRSLWNHVQEQIRKNKDMFGFNLAALGFLGRINE